MAAEVGFTKYYTDRRSYKIYGSFSDRVAALLVAGQLTEFTQYILQNEGVSRNVEVSTQARCARRHGRTVLGRHA